MQAYYFVNQFHDHLLAAPIGFTEAAGNFQQSNSSGQGVGHDAVQVHVLFGANSDHGLPLPQYHEQREHEHAARRAGADARAAAVPQGELRPEVGPSAAPATTPRSCTTSTPTVCTAGS